MSQPRLLARNTALIDLFAGPGGLSLGFKKTGFKIACAIECDPCAGMTYEHNFCESRLFKKRIENVSPSEVIDVLSKDSYQRIVVVGGPPCQPFSSANRQTNGEKNPQASAVDYFVRFIEEIMPDAFLFENVVSFGYINKGRSVKILEQELMEIGYEISVKIISFDMFGVPQHRKRLFIGGLRRKDYPIGFKIPKKGRNKSRITVKNAISDLPLLKDGGGGEDEMEYPKNDKLTSYQKKARAGSSKIYNHWCSKNSDSVVETMKCIKKGYSLKKSWNKLPPSIKARYKNPDAIHNNIYKRLTWNEPSPTIVHARRAMLLHPLVNRIITVREAARLQNFPDKFRFYGGIHNQYQQIANAVPPGAMEVLAKSFLKYLAHRKS